MAKTKRPGTQEGFDVENTLSKTEEFIEKNQRILITVVVILVIIIGGYFGYKRFILAPKKEEAKNSMFMAETYFERDSFALALQGDNLNIIGFEEIIDEYGSTPSGKLARFYAGICCLHLQRFDEAIEYLEDFDTDIVLVQAAKLAAIGDAYAEKNNPNLAIEYYLKASELKPNDLTAPFYLLKAGIICEEIADFEQAFNIYTKIEQQFPEFYVNKQIIKYKTRAQRQTES